MKGYIYKIVNKINGKFYIGSTLNVQARKERHFNELKQGKHHSIFLQRAYDKYGEEQFDFMVIKEKEFDTEELRMLEERYINFCWNTGKLYNVSRRGSGGDLVSYHPLFEEIKEKQRIATTKKWESKSEEERKAYAEKMRGEGNPNYGHKWNDEQRKQASIRKKEYFKTHSNFMKGKTFEEVYGEEHANEIKRKLSELRSQNIGEKNPFYGKHHSEETKKKLSKMRRGQKPADAKKVLYNGEIFESAACCAKKLGINYLTVAYRCRKQIYGFSYIDDVYSPRAANERLDLEKCIEVVKQCKTKKDLREKQSGVIVWLKKHGYYEEICKQYFTELRHRWSFEEVVKIARKYNSYSEFWKSEPKVVSVMYRKKWINNIKAIFNE